MNKGETRNRIAGLRMVRAGDLAPHAGNWRAHGGRQEGALREMLEKVGWAAALVAYESPDGLVLIDGHLRASLDPTVEVPVLVLDVSEKEADILLATLDPIGAMAGADRGALTSLLERIDAGSGPVARMLSELLASSKHPKVKVDPDHVPSGKARSRLGDLYGLGRHRLLVGDARNPSDLERLAGEDRAELLIADPPYGVNLVGRGPGRLEIENDAPEDLPGLLADSFAAIDAVLAPRAAIYVFHPSGPNLGVFLAAIGAVGWRLRQDIIWCKDQMVLTHQDYHARHEPIAYCAKGSSPFGRGRAGWFGSDAEQSVIDCPRPKSSPLHPSTKPVALIERLITNSSPPGSWVLDPYLGSGTSLVAAERAGRHLMGLEIDPAYADVALSRWENFTDEEAQSL